MGEKGESGTAVVHRRGLLSTLVLKPSHFEYFVCGGGYFSRKLFYKFNNFYVFYKNNLFPYLYMFLKR